MRLSDHEYEALSGLPWGARCLYLFALRRYMDYATGIVGIKRRVSWQSLAEELYIDPHQGRTDAGTPTKARVRRMAQTLESAGLILSQSREKQLVFRLPLATTDSSAHKKPGTNPAQTRHTQPDTQPGTPNASNGAGYPAKPDTEPDKNPTHPKEAKPGIHPESGSPGKPKRDSRARGALDTTCLPDDLSEQVWKDWLQHRKDKKAPVRTQTVVDRIAKELEKARALGWSPNEALAEAMAAGWQGIKAEWLANRTKAAVTQFPKRSNRRGGFDEIDYEAEAKEAGFQTGGW